MSTTQSAKLISVEAGENLNGDLYETLKINSSGQFVKTTDAADIVAAILFQDPGQDISAGDHVTVMDIAAGGIGLVKAQGAISAGELLAAHATDGKADGHAAFTNLASNQSAFGIALEAATAANEIIRFKAYPIGPKT